MVVGHAGGTPTAIELAAANPSWVRALVCEEGAALPFDPAVDAMLAAMIEQLTGPGYADAMKVIYPGFFHPNTDRDLVAACAADAAKTSPQVAVAYLAAMSTMDTATPARNLARCRCCSSGRNSHSCRSPSKTFKTPCRRRHSSEIPGTAHFAHLDAPYLVQRRTWPVHRSTRNKPITADLDAASALAQRTESA